jgi:hypothetical protein
VNQLSGNSWDAFVLFHGEQSSLVPVYAILLSVGYFAATKMLIAVYKVGVCCEMVFAGVCGVPCWSALLFGRLALRPFAVGNAVNQFVGRIHATLLHL